MDNPLPVSGARQRQPPSRPDPWAPARPGEALPQAWPPADARQSQPPHQSPPARQAQPPHQVVPPAYAAVGPIGPAHEPGPWADGEHAKESPHARHRWFARVFGAEADETTAGLTADWDTMLGVLDAPVARHRITVHSLRPRSGKTTTLLGLGTALALHRREPVTSLDAADGGMLAERVGAEHHLGVRDLVERLQHIHTASDLRRFTSIARSRLEVLGSSPGHTMSANDHAAALQVLLTFRPVVLTDLSSDPGAPVLRSVFAATDSLVVPVPLDPDGIRSAVETLAWWERNSARGPRLVAQAVLVLCRQAYVPDPQSRGRGQRRLMDEFEAAQDAFEDEALRVFAARVGAVVPVPADPTLEEPGLFWWDDLEPETQDAYINVAYEVARAFRPSVTA